MASIERDLWGRQYWPRDILYDSQTERDPTIIFFRGFKTSVSLDWQSALGFQSEKPDSPLLAGLGVHTFDIATAGRFWDAIHSLMPRNRAASGRTVATCEWPAGLLARYEPLTEVQLMERSGSVHWISLSERWNVCSSRLSSRMWGDTINDTVLLCFGSSLRGPLLVVV